MPDGLALIAKATTARVQTKSADRFVDVNILGRSK